jgi:hypothetical protein
MRRLMIPILCVLCLLPVFLRGAAPASQPANSKGMMVRTYDVSDLLRLERDYPLDASMIPISGATPAAEGGGGGGGGGGSRRPEIAGPTNTNPVTIGTLLQMIATTIDPESWGGANGGGAARITGVGNVLVVSQTAENQSVIADLLESLAKETAAPYMVAVRAYWLMLEPADLESITKAAGEKTVALKEVPPQLLDSKKVYATGQTLGFSGQTVHIMAQKARDVITGADPVVGTGVVGYNVRMTAMNSGVALQVTPRIHSSGETAVIDLQSFVNEVGDPAPVDVTKITATSQPESQIGELMKLDRVNTVTQQFSSTVRIPLGKKILIGGMTMEPSRTESSRQLYLVVEANASK